MTRETFDTLEIMLIELRRENEFNASNKRLKSH